MPVSGAGDAGQHPAASVRKQMDLAGQAAAGVAQSFPVWCMALARPVPGRFPACVALQWPRGRAGLDSCAGASRSGGMSFGGARRAPAAH